MEGSLIGAEEDEEKEVEGGMIGMINWQMSSCMTFGREGGSDARFNEVRRQQAVPLMSDTAFPEQNPAAQPSSGHFRSK